MENQSNSAFIFISEKLKRGTENDIIPVKQMYKLYESFCNSRGENNILTELQFKQELIVNGYNINNLIKYSDNLYVFGAKFN